MGKPKSSETLALNKGEQKKVARKTKKLKRKIKEGKITIKQHKPKKFNVAQSRGLVYIAHIPHGFFENEMKNYFKQFGVVTNIRLCRSKKNGNSKGYGYVEFSHPEVAKIAAETMNNYLMFKKRIIAEYVPYEKRPKGLFKGKSSTPARYSSKVRREKQIAAISQMDYRTHLLRAKARLSNLLKKMERLKNVGIDSNIQPTDLPIEIKQEKASDEEFLHADLYDSDIEVRIPLKKSRKSVKSTASKVSSKRSKSSKKSNRSTASNKISLAKSLDSVKALLSSKSSGKPSNLKLSGSVKKVNKATSIPIFKKNKDKNSKLKGITKRSKKPKPLDADTVKKIARELIRRRGDSLLNLVTPKTKSNKKKPL